MHDFFKIDFLVHLYLLHFCEFLIQFLDKIAKSLKDWRLWYSLWSENVREKVEVALCENTVPVLFFLLFEDIRKQEADKIVGPNFALFGHVEDDKLYGFGCFDGKYFVLEY